MRYQEGNNIHQRKHPLFLPLPIHTHYAKLKQLSYFRNLFRKYPPKLLQEILPYFIWKIHNSYLQHDEYVYIPAEASQFEIGIPIPYGHTLKKSIYMYKISRHTHEIFNVLLDLEYDLFKGLTLEQRFWMFCQSSWYHCPFNRYLIKQGQPSGSVVITLDGEFKEVEKDIYNIRFIHEVEVYGPQYTYMSNWTLTIKSNSNQCRALIIDQEILSKYLNLKMNELFLKNEISKKDKKNKKYHTLRIQSEGSIGSFSKRYTNYLNENGNSQVLQSFFQENIALVSIQKRKTQRKHNHTINKFKIINNLFENQFRIHSNKKSSLENLKPMLQQKITFCKKPQNLLKNILLKKYKNITMRKRRRQ